MLHERYGYEALAARTWPTHMDTTMSAPTAPDPMQEQAMAVAYAAITAGAHGSDGGRLMAAERMEAAF